MKMDLAISSETLVNICQAALRHITEDSNIHCQHLEKPMPHSCILKKEVNFFENASEDLSGNMVSQLKILFSRVHRNDSFKRQSRALYMEALVRSEMSVNIFQTKLRQVSIFIRVFSILLSV
jgi:hypothetical protein